MLCLVCGELIIKTVTYKNIFKTNIHKLCDSCFKKNIYIQHYEAIPINNYMIELHTLFEKEYEPLALMGFLKPYYIYYMSNKQDCLILYFDTFDTIIYNILHNLELGDIFLITLSNITIEGEWWLWSRLLVKMVLYQQRQ